MKSLLLIFLLLFFSNSCKKDDQKPELPNPFGLVSGTFHVSGKIFLDCSNAPWPNQLIDIGWREGTSCWSCPSIYKSFDTTVTDDNGNFYFEYTVTDFNPWQPFTISLQGPQLSNIPSGVDVENIIIQRFQSTVVELYLNFINTPTADSIQLSGGFGWFNISAPYHSGYLMTYAESGFIAHDYNEPRKFPITYHLFGSSIVYKDTLFEASICDTTIAVLNFE